MTALEELKAKLVTAKGKYPQPMLLSQMQYLYRLVQGADQIPGRDVYERLEELKQQLEELGD